MVTGTGLPMTDQLNAALACHEATPCRAIDRVRTHLWPTDRAGVMAVRFDLQGAIDRLVLSPKRRAGRQDGLWRTTCCEIFLAGATGNDYAEINLSPSTRWAAYRFDTYRGPAKPLSLMTSPAILAGPDGDGWSLKARIDLAALDFLPAGPLHANIAAVVETDAGISYWASRHGPGTPDFHHRDCFIVQIPAAWRP